MIGGLHWSWIVVGLMIAVPCAGLTWVVFQDNWRDGRTMLVAAFAIPLVPFLIAWLLGVRGLVWGDYAIWYLGGLAVACLSAALLYLRRGMKAG